MTPADPWPAAVDAAVAAVRPLDIDRAERLVRMAGAAKSTASTLGVHDFAIVLFEVLADGIREGSDQGKAREALWAPLAHSGVDRTIFDRSIFCLEVYASLVAFELAFGPERGAQIGTAFLGKAGGPFRLRRKLPGRARVRWQIDRYREAADSDHAGGYASAAGAFAVSCAGESGAPPVDAAVHLVRAGSEAFYTAAAGTIHASLATDVVD